MSIFSDFIEESSEYIYTTSQGLLSCDFCQDITNAMASIDRTLEEKATLALDRTKEFFEDIEIKIERLLRPTPSSPLSRWVQSVENRSEDVFRKLSRHI